MKYFVGIDIGGTKCAVSLGVEDGDEKIKIIDKRKIDTPKGALPSDVMKMLADEAEAMISSKKIECIGISCGGPLDSKRGVILSPPNLIGWDEVYIGEYFEKRFNVPISLQNDANACALAEWKFGAGIGKNNIIFLTFGTGLGAGLILDGRLYSGTNDMAGEVGHIRLDRFGPVGYGKAGSFEGFCSGSGIAQLAKSKALEKFQMGEKPLYCKSINELDTVTAKTVAQAARAGDATAAEVYRICGEYLGKGLSVLIDLLNPELIIIGSVFQRSEDLLREEAERVIKEEALSLSSGVCKVVPAKLAENIGDYAALAVALEEFTAKS